MGAVAELSVCVSALLLSAPLSVASGCIGLAQYAGFLTAGFGDAGDGACAARGGYSFGVSAGRATWLAIAVVGVAVVLLYRRLAAMRGLSAGMLVVVLGTIAWAMVTGLLHGEWSRVVAFPAWGVAAWITGFLWGWGRRC